MEKPKRRPERGLLLEAQHQLRQPLNALGLLIGELRLGLNRRELDEIAEDMRSALTLSNAWLNSLADLEMAEQGLLELEPRDVPLQPIFDRLREDFGPRFAGLGLGFRVVATRAAVRADPAFLRRLLTLLLDNAAKFTREGRVLLGCRRAGGAIRIEVWDSGLGIEAAESERLFEPFYRLENEVRPRERGLGLGLAYAHRLAELAGDSLAVRSQPGRGSCFMLTVQQADGVPAAPERRPPAAAPAGITNPLEGAEVPVLEGPEAPGLRASLESWGAQVRILSAASLAAALAQRPPLLIAGDEAFAAAGGWRAKPDGISDEAPESTTVVLVGEPTPKASAMAGADVHFLQRPVKPARLRALCHFALTRSVPVPPSD